ncbi:MAG: hypothetical protein KDL87_10065 [Verrucomicrobiae bacterium]|nr:hypothetical protein [Verrucomicrobiae bacterium]
MSPRRMNPLPLAIGAIACLGIAFSANAQSGSKSGGGSSLGDLLNKVKDIKVPESVSNLPNQLAELKESYLETTKTVDSLRTEVAALREEVEALKADNAALREAVGVKVAANERGALLKPLEVSASELMKSWRDNRETAATQYGGRYLRVVGTVEGFETAIQEIVVLLKTDTDSKIRCHIRRDASFHAEVIANQGRLVDRNDRSTILTVGQPVAVLGTCDGFDLDVKLSNCRIEGMEVRRLDPPKGQN